ncbi:MAG TPA: aminotransferase class V-fold PLP-dependent enzyme [Polyangium sp.]|nr:aminotransferase class V-fold PLP-dependent enzyme [Polyangium sp.]
MNTDFPPSHAARVRPLWTLDANTTFLNHGSFGACPKPVLDVQSEFRAQLERQPVRFFLRESEKLLGAAFDALGQVLGANPEDLAFMSNATAGVNTVLRSLQFAPGDEILITDHGYNACNNAVRFVAEKSGARVVVVPFPYPITNPDEIVEAILAQVTPGKTKLALFDHITSPTAIVLPIEKIVPALHERGVDSLIDGAHAPGMVPVDLNALGAAYYAGNCHKWLCAPKGAAFLHVRKDKQQANDDQPLIRPLSISHGANAKLGKHKRFRLEFDWTGTDDPTAWLSIPAAIRFLTDLLPGGLAGLREYNHALAVAARRHLCATFNTPPPVPDSMIGSLATIVLPEMSAEVAGPNDHFGISVLQERLFTRHSIEVPIIVTSPQLVNWPARFVRISAQIYNDPEDYRRLGQAILTEIKV